MPTPESLAQRYEAVLQSYTEHRDLISATRLAALNDLLPDLATELGWEDDQLERSRVFLDDAGSSLNIYRFLRRARFDSDGALALLRTTLAWRASSSVDTLSAAALEPQYLDCPLFYFHRRLVDRFGRPCAILNLRHVLRTPDGSLDALREYIIMGWEVARRYLAELTRKRGDDDPVVQVVLIVDVGGSGMSNLELELLPMMLDLLKSHYPSMVGCSASNLLGQLAKGAHLHTVFVMNFGWAYAGMFAIVKRVLPKPALERMLFPNKADLLQFFNNASLLEEHGGTMRYRYSFKGSVFARLGRPVYASPAPSTSASPRGSRTPSRVGSIESLADIYHSASGTPHNRSRPGTPGGSHRNSPVLSMTNIESAVAANARKADRPLRKRNSSADLRQHFPARDPMIVSSDSDLSGDEAIRARVERRRGDSAASSRAVSRAPSRDASPARSRSGTVEQQKLSRFSASNPFFGYPVHHDAATGMAQPARRRRKRDLLQTLSYLVLLRLLALRRTLAAEVIAIYDAVLARLRALGLAPRARRRPRGRIDDVEEGEATTPRRGKRRKAVTFELTDDDDEVEDRRQQRRRAGPASATRNLAGVKVAAVLLLVVLAMRSGRVVCWLQAGEPGGRRARLRRTVRGLIKAG